MQFQVASIDIGASLVRADVIQVTGRKLGDRPYAVNALNQYTSAGNVTFGYDGRGNLTQSGSAGYGYNSRNLLSSASGVGATTLYYDPEGLVDQSWSSGDEFDNVAGRVASEWRGGVLRRRYVYGPGADEPLVWYEGAGTNDKRWLHADERGSVIAVTMANGVAHAINRYDEYGIPAPGNIGRFGYTGQKWIPELGMYDYKARMYSPTLGRFMQTDPIGYADGMNWYDYVGGDPVNRSDPTGLQQGPIIVTGRRLPAISIKPPKGLPKADGGDSSGNGLDENAARCGGDLYETDAFTDCGPGTDIIVTATSITPQSDEPSTADVVVTGQRIAANQSCASALSAPGTCSLPYCEWLRLKQVLACQGIRTCTEAMTPDELAKQIEKRMECAQARSKLNSQCFRGGDAGHNRAVDQLWDGVMKCQSVSIRKYGICPAPWAR